MGVTPGSAGAQHQGNTFLHDLILRKTGAHNAPIKVSASILVDTRNNFPE
jgi:hypothetical protein